MEKRDLNPVPALSGFDRIYVLNLPERADRRREGRSNR